MLNHTKVIESRCEEGDALRPLQINHGGKYDTVRTGGHRARALSSKRVRQIKNRLSVTRRMILILLKSQSQAHALPAAHAW